MGMQDVKRAIEDAALHGHGPIDFSDDGIKADVIAESTAAAGVTIDGVLCKDNAVTASGGLTGAITGNVTGNVTGDVTGSVATESGDTLKLFPASLAATGSVLANAAPIAAIVTVVTGADNTKAVALPAAAAGLTYIIVNSSTDKTLPVFPQVADKINGGTANSSITMAAATAAVFVALDGTDWYTVPKTPS